MTMVPLVLVSRMLRIPSKRAGRHFINQFGDAFGAGKLFFEGGAACAKFHLDGADVFGRDFNDNFFEWLSTVWPSSSWVTTCGRPTSNS